jgi:hypothetical protein
MNKEAWNIFFVIRQDGAGPLVREKPVMLSDCAPEKKIVDDGRINFLLQKPSSRRIGSQRNRIVILHASLPTAEGC